MKKSSWIMLMAALGMMAATGGYLAKIHLRIYLGQPGVKVGPVPLYNELGQVVATQSVLLPAAMPGFKVSPMPIKQHEELEALPRDTTFGRKLYTNSEFSVLTSVVLMGSDRTSIHQPQYCLDAQAWHIDATDRVLLPMDRPYPYRVPALRLTTTHTAFNKFNQTESVRGIYVYWFVSGENITSDQNTRMWSIMRTMLEKGELERWAYISYFTTCVPGREEATYKELERFIRASAPEFQTVAGRSEEGRLPVAAR